jgi:Mn2+/Fe2+ NRAMP family transporter
MDSFVYVALYGNRSGGLCKDRPGYGKRDLRSCQSKTVLYAVVGLVIVANTINIGADIGAMASTAQLLIPTPFVLMALGFTFIILLLEIFTSYCTYSKILKCLAVTLLAYPLTLFIAHQPWGTVLKATITPHLEFNFAFLFISPYMFFWEASQEVEEQREAARIFRRKSQVSLLDIKKMRIDNNFGMIFSEFATWSIIVVCANVLHKSGVSEV